MQIIQTLHEVFLEDGWPLFLKVMPSDAYLACNGRLHISITVITCWGLQNKIVNVNCLKTAKIKSNVSVQISTFTSNEDVRDACLASSSIPFLTERGPPT